MDFTMNPPAPCSQSSDCGVHPRKAVADGRIFQQATLVRVDYNSLNEEKMRIIVARHAILTIAGAALLTGSTYAQDTPPQDTQTPAARSNVRKAIRWKQFNYTCEGGAKLYVYLSGDMAKIRFGDNSYFMKQTMSADGNRYSDGKTVWWGKGNGGFLQEDTPDGNGKMIVQGCQLDKPPATESVTGTVSYLQRMALPTNAVIQVQLSDVSLADAPAKMIAEQTINLGQRQVPIPFALTFDPSKIDSKHTYSVSAKITVDGKLSFITDKSHPVLTNGNPSHVDLILKQVPPPK
jgi:putative lipoprotein